jgi:hypothetical protein
MELIDVYFVDFGYSEYVRLRDLRKLLNKFYELPMLAVECMLEDVCINNSSEKNENEQRWPNESVDYFEEIVYSCKRKPLKLEFIRYTNSKDDANSLSEASRKAMVRLYDRNKV